MPPINADASAQLLCIIIIGKGLECAIKLWSHSIFNMKKKTSDFSEKELLEKILSILAEKEDSPVRAKQVCTRQLYSNKELMDLLQVKDRYLKKLRDNGYKDRYLKKLRDNGYIGYSREGDKYWYTQDDVNKFLRKFHYEAFATNPNLPERKGGDVW